MKPSGTLVVESPQHGMQTIGCDGLFVKDLEASELLNVRKIPMENC